MKFIDWLFGFNRHIWVTEKFTRTCLSCGRQEHSHHVYPLPSDWYVDCEWAFANNVSTINEENKNVCKN